MRVLQASAFEEFARMHAQWLVRLAYLLTGQHQSAEDLAQDTLLAAYRHWSKVLVAKD